MKKHNNEYVRPGLLVSVRNADEALAALAGGVDVIDVKEPDRGPLGAADSTTIEAVVRAVNARVPVTAAMGELTELIGTSVAPLPSGISFFKIGLAGCGPLPDWRAQWHDVIAALVGSTCREGAGARRGDIAAPTAVVYADWRSADAPGPDDVLNAAVEAGCPALLIDTWDKTAGSLFDHWPGEQLGHYLRSVRSQGLLAVLAGSLANESFAAAAGLGPDLVAVRTAACEGGRRGAISSGRIRDLQAMLASIRPANAGISGRPENFLDNASEFRILETT